MENKDDFLVDIVLDIVRVANLLDKLGAQYAKMGGISSVQQYKILAMLFAEDDLSMSDLRDNTLVTKQAVTGLVSRLNKNELLETYQDPNDRRITRVNLTNKGREALEIAKPHRIVGNRKALAILNDEEMSQLSSILNKLIFHLKE